MIVSCRCNTDSHQVCILIHCCDGCQQEDQELNVLSRCFAGIQKVLAGIGDDRPVVVLAGAVDSVKRLLMQKACVVVLVRNLLHHLHGQLVVIHGDIGRLKNRCKLMLAGSNLVVLGLGGNALHPDRLLLLRRTGTG